MAVTALLEEFPGYPQAVGAKLESIFKVTLSGTYTTGGFTPVSATGRGFSGVEFSEGSYEVNNSNRFALSRLTRVILHVRATGAEVAAGTNVTGDVYIFKVRGV